MADPELSPYIEQALQDSEAKFQAILETASLGIVLVNEEGTILLVNGRAEEMFDYRREELIGQLLELLLPERYRPRHARHRADYAADPRVRSMGHLMTLAGRRSDGSEFPIEVGLSYIRTADGILTISFITDITERRNAEEALHTYARRLEATREIDRAILAADLPSEIAAVALRHLREVVPFESAKVLLFDFGAGEAHTLVALGNGAMETDSRRPLETVLNLAALREGAYQLTRSIAKANSPGISNDGPEARTSLDVPLLAEGELIGALQLIAPEAEHFDGDRLEIAREVANQLAIALQQAQFRKDLERHATELELRVVERTHELERRHEVAKGLRDILATLNSNRPLESILDYIVALAGRLLDTDATALFHLVEQEHMLTIRASHGLPADYVANLRMPVGQGAAGRSVNQREPVAVGNVVTLLRELGESGGEIEEQEFLKFVSQRYRALLAVPLIVKEEVFGSIVLYFSQPRQFSQEEIELAVAFADQATLAIENSRLRAQVEQSAVAAERNRLARDLHDAVTQTLFSASLIAEVLPRLWQRSPDEAQKRLDDLRQLTRGALAEMRTLLFELRPAVLTKTELGELLRQLGEATTGRSRVPVSVTVEGEAILLPEVQIALYRIAQEALNNVAKHSAATEANVSLVARPISEGSQVILRIRDNGKGFDQTQVAAQRLGLAIMSERAAAIQAALTISSQPGKGTEIEVIWPAIEEENR